MPKRGVEHIEARCQRGEFPILSRVVRLKLVFPILLLTIWLVMTPSAVAAPQGAGGAGVYVWWMARWSDNTVLCEILTETAAPPDGFTIYLSCGVSLHAAWLSTPACITEDTSTCEGVYVFPVGTRSWDSLFLASGSGEFPNLASCTWDLQPEQRIAAWIPPVAGPEQLVSDVPLTWLAGYLLKEGIAQADSCEGGGLLPNGAADNCGLESARPQVYEWQNQWNNAIFDASFRTDVPAWLLKGLIAQESQFWPNVGIGRGIANVESGLGQLTEHGAETALIWNRDLFNPLCFQLFYGDTCTYGYSHLEPAQQAMLRGALLDKVYPSCSNCEYGFDAQEAEASILTLARVLQGFCGQAGYMLVDITAQPVSAIANYSDMMRFTLLDYNRGSGCLAYALNEVADANEPFTWENVISYLAGDCLQGVDYVNRVVNFMAGYVSATDNTP